jgi:carbamoyltransferase
LPATCRIKTVECCGFVFYDKALLKFERLVETYYAFCSPWFYSFLVPVWMRKAIPEKIIDAD